jgi:hypothetical protein
VDHLGHTLRDVEDKEDSTFGRRVKPLHLTVNCHFVYSCVRRLNIAEEPSLLQIVRKQNSLLTVGAVDEAPLLVTRSTFKGVLVHFSCRHRVKHEYLLVKFALCRLFIWLGSVGPNIYERCIMLMLDIVEREDNVSHRLQLSRLKLDLSWLRHPHTRLAHFILRQHSALRRYIHLQVYERAILQANG